MDDESSAVDVFVRPRTGRGLGPVAAVHPLLGGLVKDVMGTGDPWGIIDASRAADRHDDGRLEEVGRRLFRRGLACNWQAALSHESKKRDS